MTNVLVLILVFFTLMSSLDLALSSGTPDWSASAPSDTGISAGHDDHGATGSLNYHLATEADIQRMKEQLINRGTQDSITTGAPSDGTHTTGLSNLTEERLDSLVGKIAVFDSYDAAYLLTTPSAYDISSQPYFPEVRDQSTGETCAAFSVIYYNYGYLEAEDNGWTDACLGNEDHLLSPGWTFNKVIINGGGSIIADNALVAKSLGVCTWSLLPYDSTDYEDWGNEAAWRDAPAHRVDDVVYYPYTGTATIRDIKASLASDHPVTIALNSSAIGGNPASAFADGNYVLSSDEYGSSYTNHAVTIVGYDDSITDDGDVGAFKAVNSWGSSFGDSGYFWISYDAVEEIGNLLQAISLTDKADYRPSSLAVLHFNWSPTFDAPITFSAVRYLDGAVMAEVSPYFYTNSYSFMPSFMCQDISDLSAYLMDSDFGIRLTVGESYISGTVSSYRLEWYAGPYVAGKASAIGPETAGLPTRTPASIISQLPSESIVAPSEALSYYDGAFTYSTETQWVGVRDVQGRTHVMQSGDVGDSSNSTLIAEVRGPGTFSFDWKVSSEPDYDYLNFLIDGTLVQRISNDTSWTTVASSIHTGVHRLEWTYAKDQYNSNGSDCGWIDNVIWEGISAVLFDDFEPSGTDSWYAEDTDASAGTDLWAISTLLSGTGSQALWCAGSGIGWNGLPNGMNGYYDVHMNASVSIVLPDLTGTSGARLSFEYWAITNGTDHLYVRINDGHSWRVIWVQPTPISGGWARVDVAIPSDAVSLEFRFVSDHELDIGYPGVFIDNVMVTVSDPYPPSSWIGPLSTFTNDSGTDLTCNLNDIGSGIAYVQIYYRKGTAGAYSLYTNETESSSQWTGGTIHIDPMALGLEDGPYQFYSVATDRAGNRETVPSIADASTTLDRSKPTTTAMTDGTASPGWNTRMVNITLNVSDLTSGVSLTSYRIDSGTWTGYTGPIQCSAPGIHSIQYFSSDVAGNFESMRTLTVRIDFEGPTSSATVNGVTGNAGWYVTNVTLAIDASDQLSGVQSTQYRMDGGEWLTYSGAVNFTDQGDHTVHYASVDVAGNRGNIGTMSFKVDREAPATSCTVVGPGNPADMMFNASVVVGLTSQDLGSGLLFTRYSLDGGVWSDYLGTVAVGAAGNHTLTFRSGDQAGNVEAQRWNNFTVDATAPTSDAVVSGDRGNAGWYIGNVTVDLRGSDGGSGVNSTYYRLQGAAGAGSWIQYTGIFTVPGDGCAVPALPQHRPGRER